MNEQTNFVPNSAKLECAGCEASYDYRDTPDRACPECGCPASTVVEQRPVPGIPDGLSRHFVPNPEQAEWLSANADHVSKTRRTVSNREAKRRSREAKP